MSRPTVILVVILVHMVTANAISAENRLAVPDTPAGTCVIEYFAAYNGGEETMTAFVQRWIADQSLKQRPLADRLAVYREMRLQMGSLRPDRVGKVDSTAISVLAADASGSWFSFTFLFEPAAPHKLLGIRVETTDPELFSQPQTPMSEAEFLDSLGRRLEVMAGNDEFSGVVLVAKSGKSIYQYACGLADKAFAVPNRTDTKFNLGSINKFFTRTAIGQLVQQGKIRFDDTLGTFLPDYPNSEARRTVTVNHLLTMQGGVGDFFGERFEKTPKDRFRTNNDFLPMFDSLPLAFEPGTQQQYSNGGYVVLGAIIEKVTGRSYYDYVRDNIFLPAGMTSTDSYEADVPTLNLAEGYTRASDDPSAPWVNNIYTRPARGSSAGGGYSTAEDLLKFTIALQEHKLLDSAFTKWLVTGERPDKSSAAASGAMQPGIGIAGGAPGINACLEVDFASGYTIVVLGNYDPPNAMRVAQLARMWLDRVSGAK